MEAGFILLLVAVAVICTVIGVNIGHMRALRKSTKGILNVDCDYQSGGPYLFLQLTVPVEDVTSQKQVIFDVNVLNTNSQK